MARSGGRHRKKVLTQRLLPREMEMRRLDVVKAPRTPFHAVWDRPTSSVKRCPPEEATLAKQSAEVKAVADDAQADLDVAMPALNNAVKALDSLTKADITEVKAFAKPVRGSVLLTPSTRLVAISWNDGMWVFLFSYFE